MRAWFARTFPRLRALVRRDAVVDDITSELQFHFEMRVAEYERHGLTHAEAVARARARVGNLAAHRDRGYDVRGGRWLETVWYDARFAVRLLLKQRRFAALALATIALSTGTTTALFSVVDATVVRPMPFERPEELHTAYIRAPRRNGTLGSFGPSYADVAAWRASPLIAAAGKFRSSGSAVIVVSDVSARRVKTGEMSDGVLDVFRVRPILGRALQADDIGVGRPTLVLLGCTYWREEFSARATVVGDTVRLPSGPAQILGVLPRDFYPHIDVWMSTPVRGAQWLSRRGLGDDAVLRLRPGTPLPDVTADLAMRAKAQDAQAGISGGVTLSRAVDDAASGYTATLRMLSMANAAIVLLGCANVAGLLIALISVRVREFAVRAAIGAGRRRLIQQSMVESAVLTAIGGGVGVGLAALSLHALVNRLPITLPGSAVLALNGRVLAWSLLAMAALTFLIGALPAWLTSRTDVSGALKSAGRQVPSAHLTSGRWLVGAEVALAFVVLAAAGLLLSSVNRILAVDLGFDPHAVVAIEATPADQSSAALSSYYESLVGALRQVPGVAAVGAGSSIPMGRSMMMTSFAADDGDDQMMAVVDVTPGFLEALDVPFEYGAAPTTAGDPRDLVLGHAAAAKLFGEPQSGGLAVRTLKGGARVLGVARDVRWDGPAWSPDPVVYRPTRTFDQPAVVLLRAQPGVRLDPTELTRLARAAGKDVTVDPIRTLAAWRSDNIRNATNRAQLFTLLAVLGLMLALIGIFGVTSYTVARRAPELGVRLALGAAQSQVTGLVLRSAAWPIGLGAAVGATGALAATKLLSKFLFDTAPTDPRAFASAAATLALAAFLAAWLPARRAALVDPAVTLRGDS